MMVKTVIKWKKPIVWISLGWLLYCAIKGICRLITRKCEYFCFLFEWQNSIGGNTVLQYWNCSVAFNYSSVKCHTHAQKISKCRWFRLIEMTDWITKDLKASTIPSGENSNPVVFPAIQNHLWIGTEV